MNENDMTKQQVLAKIRAHECDIETSNFGGSEGFGAYDNDALDFTHDNLHTLNEHDICYDPDTESWHYCSRKLETAFLKSTKEPVPNGLIYIEVSDVN